MAILSKRTAGSEVCFLANGSNSNRLKSVKISFRFKTHRARDMVLSYNMVTCLQERDLQPWQADDSSATLEERVLKKSPWTLNLEKWDICMEHETSHLVLPYTFHYFT